MLDQATLVTYLAILVGFVFVPGPAVLLTLARASSSGVKVGLATGLGIAVGDLVHTLLAVVGISAVVLASAFLFGLIKWLGAAYLIYLGVKALCTRTGPVLPRPGTSMDARAAFGQAVLVEILNPKSALFFLAFLPQFVNPGNGLIALQLMTLGGLFVMMGFFSTALVAVGAGGISRLLRRHPTIVRWQNRLVGGVYCALGVRLALQQR